MKFAVLVVVAACASAQDVRDSDERMVADCEYIQDVQGKSGWGGAIATGAGINGAKKSARKATATIGGTHVVWGQIATGAMTYIQGRAYRCEKTSSEPPEPEGADQ